MHRRRYLKSAAGIASLSLVAGCTGGNQSTGDGSGGGLPEGPLKIGGLEPLSGPFNAWGNSHLPGMQFAVEEINGNGGIDGTELEVVDSDTKSEPSEADSIFRRFVEQDDVVAAAGPVSSDVGIRTAQTAEDVGVPLVLHMSGSDKVITKETKHVYRLALLPAATLMKAWGQFLADRDYTKIGAVIADYSWGHAVKAGIESSLPDNVQIETAPVGASSFTSLLRKFPEDLEVMIPTGHPPGLFTMVPEMYELGLDPEVVTGGGGLPASVLVGAMGENVTRGMTETYLVDTSSDGYVDVAKRYSEQKGKQFHPSIAYGYVTVKMIAHAIRETGSADPAEINQFLKGMKFDTIFPSPVEYSEYGELKNTKMTLNQFKLEAPEYMSDGKFSIEKIFTTDPLPALPPEE